MNLNCNYWMVIDKVRVPQAIEALQAVMEIDTIWPLFAGSDFDYMMEQSPLLINLVGNDELLPLWQKLKFFDSSSVLFKVDSSVSTETLLKHLQNLLLVYIDSTNVLLRFYTNVIWQQVAEHLNEEDKTTILGPANALLWMDENQQIQEITQNEPSKALPELPYQLTSTIFKQWV